jgi:hypothetical protein
LSPWPLLDSARPLRIQTNYVALLVVLLGEERVTDEAKCLVPMEPDVEPDGFEPTTFACKA